MDWSSYLCAVSNTAYLLQKYRESAQVQAIVEGISQPSAKLALDGLKGAQRALVLAATALNTNVPHMAICETKEEAAYLLNDLAGLLGEEHVWFFPDSFKRPRAFEDLNPTQMLQRSETINKMSAARGYGQVIVTYPEAIFEKVVRPATLEENKIDVVKNERLDVDFMIEVLVEYGFERADFVYEPGQFSIRGGIIDLFSYGNDLPYRIELFDDEVESIRTFEVASQASVRPLDRVRIVPNLNTRFRQDQKDPILYILPPMAAIWIKDTQFMLDILVKCFEAAEKFAKNINAHTPNELREIFRDRAFVYPNDIVGKLTEAVIVKMGGM
jgi:transcription-repair coupling factor (superfamily II helicase)